VSAVLTVVAPTDAQLAYIASLCREQGWQYPDAICSKDEASRIIDEMRASTYDPARYAYPWSWPVWDESIPF